MPVLVLAVLRPRCLQTLVERQGLVEATPLPSPLLLLRTVAKHGLGTTGRVGSAALFLCLKGGTASGTEVRWRMEMWREKSLPKSSDSSCVQGSECGRRCLCASVSWLQSGFSLLF